MPRTLYDVLAQIAGLPTFEGGPAGPGPVGMAPGQPYPFPGQGPPDTGFDLWRTPEGYHATPNESFYPMLGFHPLPPYSGAGEPAQGPMAPFSSLGVALSAVPPPSAQVWGVPLLPNAFRQDWTDLLREYERRQQFQRF